MFRPVGSQPPSVYWRRRLVFLASVIVLLVLIALTIKVLGSGDSGTTAGPAGQTSSSKAASTKATPAPRSSSSTSRGAPSTSARASTSGSGSGSASPSNSASSSAPPKPCASAALHLTTSTDKASYAMGTKPELSLVVTNKGSAPCVQDLGDKQIVMRVYNGESRVWGSHDCKIDPTPNQRTLDAGATVRLTIVWTGLSSQPNDCSVRPRAGAGTYTLYASLAAKEATASQFSITP